MCVRYINMSTEQECMSHKSAGPHVYSMRRISLLGCGKDFKRILSDDICSFGR